MGAQGPPGPPGKPVCKNTALAKLICNELFVPEPFITADTHYRATYVLRRGHKIYARRSSARVQPSKRPAFSLRTVRR
jgi:hypothetical protein